MFAASECGGPPAPSRRKPHLTRLRHSLFRRQRAALPSCLLVVERLELGDDFLCVGGRYLEQPACTAPRSDDNDHLDVGSLAGHCFDGGGESFSSSDPGEVRPSEDGRYVTARDVARNARRGLRSGDL